MRVARALFPISLSNQNFSSRRVLPALAALRGKYKEILFLVADRLQDYNRALALASKPGTSRSREESTSGWLDSLDSFSERRRWLEKILSRVSLIDTGCQWQILSVDSVADSTAFSVMRRIDILYAVDSVFRNDVNRTVRQFVMRHTPDKAEAAELLSRRYVLEELALSVRLKVMQQCFDEYYLGKSLPPALNLYNGVYRANVWELAGLERRPEQFRYFEWRRDAGETEDWIPANGEVDSALK